MDDEGARRRRVRSARRGRASFKRARVMPSVVENHGRPIWTPFGSGAATSGKSHGIEEVLRQNIAHSEYYRKLCKLDVDGRIEYDFMTLVDEIYELVDHAEPWMCGNARGASTGFCILFRFCEMELSDANIWHLLRHEDSPFIRVIGFLYVRYIKNGRDLLKWCEEFFNDKEKFKPSPDGKEVTMGTFVRDLLLEQRYFETILPRIPEVARREIVERIKELGYSDKGLGCGGQGGSRANGAMRPTSVKHSLSVQVGRKAPTGGSRGDYDDERRDHRDNRGSGHRDRDDYRRRDRSRSRDRDDYRRRDRSRDRDSYKPYKREDKYDDRHDRRY